MSITVNTTIPIIVTHTVSGQRLVTPLTLSDSPWLNNSSNTMAKQLATAWHKTWINEGEYLDVLRSLSTATVTADSIEVEIAASSNRLDYPQHNITFDIFIQTLDPETMIGFLPILGIEASAANLEDVKQLLIENAQLEFIRKNRLTNVHKLVELNWYTTSECHVESVELTFYTPTELDKLHEHQQQSLLQKIASQLVPGYEVAIGLEAELEQLNNLLNQTYQQSILLVGSNGCGKTALLNHYAKQNQSTLWETTAASMIQGLTEDSGWQKNLALLCQELRDKQQILYVNHLNELFEVGQYAGNSISVGETLREPLQRGEIILIAETTTTELAQLDLRSPGFSALFSHISFPTKNNQEKLHIAQHAIAALAKQHKISVSTQAIQELIQLQQRYFPYSGFPGKTIRFLETLILREKHRPELQRAIAIDRDHVIDAFCQESAMPRTLVDSIYPFDLAATQHFFQQRLFGQPQAIETVLSLLLAIKTAVLRSGKPIANLLFIGPTGVGKTELAKTLAEYIFSDPQNMLRLDMSEYSTPEAVLRLTGDTGYADASLVTKVRQQPFAVILFDELEKAHPNFFDLLLQILGEGRLTDQHGQIANFCSTIVIMTSNIGADGFQKHQMGFTQSQSQQDIKQHFMQAVQAYFRPELFNRIDQIIPFNSLSQSIQPKIVARQIKLLQQREGLASHQLKLSEQSLNLLGSNSYDSIYGARQMQRTLHQHLIIPLATELNITTPGKTVIDITEQQQQLNIQITPLDHHESDQHLTVYADQLATQRRQFQAIQEGPIYVSLLSELDKFNARKKRKGDQFWKSPDIEIYHQLSKYQQQCQTLFTQISQLETQALQTITGLDEQPSDQITNEAYQQWQADYLAFKIALYQQNHPAGKYATLALYGTQPHLDQLLKFYRTLIDDQQFTVTSYLLRIHDDHQQYQRFLLPLSKEDAKKTNKIIGYELALEGTFPYLYFYSEMGMLRWQTEEGDKLDFYIMVSDQQLELEQEKSHYVTPTGIHRRHFFEELQPRLHLKEGRLIDKDNKLSYSFNQPQQYQTMLQTQFNHALDKILLGDDA